MANLRKYTDCVMGVFDDDTIFVEAVRKLKDKGYSIKDAFTPFPVHGLEKAMGLRATRLGYVAFIFGLTGAAFAFGVMSWMMAVDWPMNIGGKPEWPVPSFIPITFELMVLLSSLGMVTFYFMRNNMLPGIEPKIYHERATQDRFVVLIEDEGNADEIKDLLNKEGAEEIQHETYVEQTAPLPLPIKMK